MSHKAADAPFKNDWQEWFKRCSSSLNRDVLTRKLLVQAPLGEWKGIISNGGYTKNELNELLEIAEKRKLRKNEIDRQRTAIEKILNFKDTGNSGKDVLALQKAQRELNSFPEGILKKFSQFLLAQESGNQSQLKKIIEQVVSWEYKVIPFYGAYLPLSDETWKSIDSLLKQSTVNLKDVVLMRAFATRVFQFISSDKLPVFYNSIDLEWTLTELRSYVNSPWYGPRYPGFWFSQMSGRVAQSELGAMATGLLEKIEAKDWELHNLWLFTEWFPAQLQAREAVMEAVTKLAVEKEKNLYLSELLIRLSENVVIRRELEKRQLITGKALFKMKRDHYLRVLESGNLTQYALYQLMAMGDEDRDYLWWLALDPF